MTIEAAEVQAPFNVFECHPDQLITIKDIVGNRGIFPVSKTTWLVGVKNGKFPREIRLSPRRVAWRAGDLQKLLRKTAKQKPTT